jgi:hypothetical protein
LNADPVFQDRSLAIMEALPGVETRIVRSLTEAIQQLMREEFDLLVVEDEPIPAIERAIEVRQHFPSLEITCLLTEPPNGSITGQAEEQQIRLINTMCSDRQLRRQLRTIVTGSKPGRAQSAEGIDPCHSLIGNLNQFSAAEILQMSCMGQRSGRFTFKSGRGTGEIYLHHGMVRHATYDTLEGEAAVTEVFRWRQGRFFFEEGLISQVQTVTRHWTHLLIDNLQKLDETMEMVSASSQR